MASKNSYEVILYLAKEKCSMVKAVDIGSLNCSSRQACAAVGHGFPVRGSRCGGSWSGIS